MSANQVSVQRPQRWDAPLDPEMQDEQVDRLMSIAPFKSMDEAAFSKALPLRGILKNDCRISVYEEGDIVIRQGDYGSSAFQILDGSLLVSLAALPAELLGRENVNKKSWLASLSQAWKNSRVAESREQIRAENGKTSTRNQNGETRVFIQDIPATLNLNQTGVLRKGQLFGELAALNRTQRSATVIASERTTLLELRWQGIRDLMKRDKSLKSYVEKLYRKHSLGGHLRQTEELSQLSPVILEQLATHTTFESFGNFDWDHKFKKQSNVDIAKVIESEPLIALEGSSADDFIMIRNGFARLSRQHGNGHRTIAYLGKGQTFGLREILHNWRIAQGILDDSDRGYSMSLRAVGYVDVVRIPATAMAALVLPNIRQDDLPSPFSKSEPAVSLAAKPERRQKGRDQELETGLLEFLVENRFMNGTQTMMIDLDRCTRCDDCVRACASTHDNNPRFLRHGPQHENWMIASACMHCTDPVCMIGCPTGAIGRDEVTGNVVIHDTTCIGCGTCANSCPYENIRMVNIRQPSGKPVVDQQTRKPVQKATKCDFCVEQNSGPACQRACPHDALFRVDLTNPSTLYQLTQQ